MPQKQVLGLAGIAAVAAGIVLLFYGQSTRTVREKVIDAGPLQVSTARQEVVRSSPLVSGALILGGAALAVFGSGMLDWARRAQTARAVGGVAAFAGAASTLFGIIRVNSLQSQWARGIGAGDPVGYASILLGIVFAVSGILILTTNQTPKITDTQ